MEAAREDEPPALAQAGPFGQAADVASFSLDAAGVIRRWDGGAERLLGWSARQVLGHSTAFLVPPERADEQERLVRQCARHGRSQRLATQRLHRDGSRVDILLTLRPLQDAEGRLVAVIGQAHPAQGAHARRIELERVMRQLTAMTDVALAAGGETNPDRVLDLIAERGRSLIERRGLVVLRQEPSGAFVVAAGTESGESMRGARLLCPSPRVGELLCGSDAPVHMSSEETMLILRTETREVRPQRALVVPMCFREAELGWLLAFEKRRDTAGFSDDEAQLLRAYGAMAAATLATARSGEDERIRRSIEASESERAHLARELHDQTLQGLGAMRVMLACARQTGDAGLMASALADAVENLGGEIDAVRRMTLDLRPAALDDLGLEAALEGLVERHRALGGLCLEATISLPTAAGAETERTIYRLVQEALTNVVKHSGAARALVRVRGDAESVAIEIEDDGCGFDPGEETRAGFGLGGMRERALLARGTLRVSSTPGSGTVVRATVPLQQRGS